MQTGALFSASEFTLGVWCRLPREQLEDLLSTCIRPSNGRGTKNRASTSEGYFKILCDFSVRWCRCSVFLNKLRLKNKQTKNILPFKKGKKSLGIKLLCRTDDLMGPAVILNWLKWLRTWLVTTICRVYRERSQKLMWRKNTFLMSGIRGLDAKGKRLQVTEKLCVQRLRMNNASNLALGCIMRRKQT